MNKLAYLGGAGGLALALAALFHTPLVRAADHLDGPTVKMSGNEMADLADVYAWMSSDAKVNVALTVSPADDGTRHFGPSIQYVFHIEQHPDFGTAGTESKLICTFANDAQGECWLVDANGKTLDYVEGDLSTASGRASTSGKLRVFAGRRSDPFFFNLSGFRTAVEIINGASLAKNSQGCPTTTGGTAAALRSTLQAMPDNTTNNGPCAQGERDCFLPFNVMAIVAQVDKSLVVADPNKLVSVWASTHAAP